MTNEIVVQETGEIIEAHGLGIFGGSDPIKIATDIANKLSPIVDQRKLYKEISGRKHVYVEGWATMGAMLGVFPRTVFSKRIDREDEIVYESRVELYTMKNQMVGAGEAICSSKERNWANRDEYAVKSMSQTRATGKAFRLSFSWVMSMAGYEGTPAEEMPDERPPIVLPKATLAPKPVSPAYAKAIAVDKIPEHVVHVTPEAAQAAKKPGVISDAQRKLLFAKTKSAGIPQDTFKEYLKNVYQIEHTAELPWTAIKDVLAWIDDQGSTPEIPFGE